MAHTPPKETKSERLVRDALKASRIPYKQEEVIQGYRVDFLIGCHIVIEVDGYTHLANDARDKDSKRENFLRSMGYRFFRIENQEALSPKSLKSFIEQIKAELKREEALYSRETLTASPFKAPLASLKKELDGIEKKKSEAPPSDEELFKSWIDKL